MTWVGGAELVMGFHPTARGFGWAVFEGPTQPVDWGLTYARGNRGGDLDAFKGVVARFRPETLALEHVDRRAGRQSTRGGRLLAAVEAYAREQGINVVFYRRGDIRRAFGLEPKATRQRVAELVAEHIDALRHRLPPPRRPWDSIDRRMALFCASALVLTHYAETD